MQKVFSFLIAVLISTLATLFLASDTFANTIRIEPAYIDVTLSEKDDQVEFEVFVTNTSNKQISIDLSSLDFRQTDSYGAIGFLGKEVSDYSYALSSFLSFESSNVEIDPGEKQRIVVTVKNRQDLSPGGHYAAIIAKQRVSTQSKETTVSPALSALVFMTKEGGERYNLSFKDIDFPKLPLVFSYPSTYFVLLQNDGNLHLTPYGRADVTDLFGRLIYKGIINENSIKVFPQSRRYIPVYSKKVEPGLPISINKLSVSGRDSLNKTAFSYNDYFLYVNPLVILVIPLGVGALLLRKRRKKRA